MYIPGAAPDEGLRLRLRYMLSSRSWSASFVDRSSSIFFSFVRICKWKNCDCQMPSEILHHQI